jgi:biofilm PGA synthesis N-glycosyltransferase PgaC
MLRVDVTWLGYFMALVSMYYVALFVLSLRITARRDPPGGPRPPVALIMPAHNEEAVIGDTLESLMRLDYDRFCVIVVNDGSTDSTSERAQG